MLLLLAGCGQEARTLEPSQPQTAPNGPDDPRTAIYEGDLYQVSQGGRYFTWYGCGQCHGVDATGALNLGDDRWKRGGGPDQVYASIDAAHPGAHYGRRIPPEQLWQITAYVRSLSQTEPDKRRRQDLDQAGEPTANSWTGPVR